jgi:hypothetical protein
MSPLQNGHFSLVVPHQRRYAILVRVYIPPLTANAHYLEALCAVGLEHTGYPLHLRVVAPLVHLVRLAMGHRPRALRALQAPLQVQPAPLPVRHVLWILCQYQAPHSAPVGRWLVQLLVVSTTARRLRPLSLALQTLSVLVVMLHQLPAL